MFLYIIYNARYITYGTTVPGTLIDRVVSIGESPLKCVFRKSGHKVSFLKGGIDGHADSIRLLLNSRKQLRGTFYGSALNDSIVK